VIVRSATGYAHLITQPDHAALSRRVMEHWAPLANAARRDSILLAIGEHDNGWREPDADPAIDETGRVIDFVNAPADVKQPVWPRGVARLAADPYAAALVAQHAITVYDRFRGDREWDLFFLEMETARDHVLGLAGISREDLQRDYAFVRLGDLISLTFCTGWREEQRYEHWRVSLDDGAQVRVTPYDLDVDELAVEVPARELYGQPFRSAAEFQAALSSAAKVTLRGTIRSSKF
jgi:Protein of unknown function (DUF3891)